MKNLQKHRRNPAPLKVLKPLAIFIEFGGLLGFIPYRWSWKTNKMKFRAHWIWRCTHCLWSLLMAFYGLFLAYQSYTVYQNASATTFAKIRIMYMSIVHWLLDIGFWLILQGYGEHHNVINQVVAYATMFREDYGAEIRVKVLKRVLSISAFVYFFGCTNALGVFLTPKSSRLLTSLLSDPLNASKGIKLGFFFVHLVINASQFYFMAFNAMALMCYVLLVLPITDKLSWSPNRNSLSPKDIYTHSVNLVILQSSYTSAFGSWLLLIFTWGIVIISLNIFQCIIFKDVRALVVGTSLSILLASVSKNAGQVFESAAKAKQSWRSIRNPSWYSRFSRGYRPTRVPIGSFFFFDRGVWPTFFDIIVSMAANLIVSFREE